jgi:hypothetical protein
MGAAGSAAIWAAGAGPCGPVPALSYAPGAVGWGPVVLCLLDVAAGVACVGLVGGALRWTADDRAPLRGLWVGLIVLGFTASAGGLYLAFANQAHQREVARWMQQASPTCVDLAAKSPNLAASTTTLSIVLGGVALALMLLGVVGAVVERRGAGPTAS